MSERATTESMISYSDSSPEYDLTSYVSPEWSPSQCENGEVNNDSLTSYSDSSPEWSPSQCEKKEEREEIRVVNLFPTFRKVGKKGTIEEIYSEEDKINETPVKTFKVKRIPTLSRIMKMRKLRSETECV